MAALAQTMSSPAPLPPGLESAESSEAKLQRNRVMFEETTSRSPSPAAKTGERRGRKQTVAFDMHAAPQAKKEVFITQVITLQEVEVAQQQFQITGFINAMWRCPDLEKEEERQDYYSRKQNENDEPTVKEGLEQVASGERKGYVLNSVAAGVTRKYITGFDLSVESDVLPFNTMKMFEDRRIVPGSFELEETVFYYYPMQHNRVSDRLAKLEENKSDMQLSKDRLKLDHATAADGVHLKCAGMIKMAARFGVKLTQRMDMKKCKIVILSRIDLRAVRLANPKSITISDPQLHSPTHRQLFAQATGQLMSAAGMRVANVIGASHNPDGRTAAQGKTFAEPLRRAPPGSFNSSSKMSMSEMVVRTGVTPSEQSVAALAAQEQVESIVYFTFGVADQGCKTQTASLDLSACTPVILSIRLHACG